MTKKDGIRIPEFESLEEEREFWDNVDLTELAEGELEPAKEIVRPARALSAQLAIRLDAESMTLLRERADQMGVGPTQLARAWIMERLKEDSAQAKTRFAELAFEQAVLDVVSRHADRLASSKSTKSGAGTRSSKSATKSRSKASSKKTASKSSVSKKKQTTAQKRAAGKKTSTHKAKSTRRGRGARS